ncbi:MAG: hypothetical protein Ct9H300mP28_10930 [Pseudomonadota bacterium]|nr:MAG: hypothetical protein Ct9H300mP28_10930 [Pseudomonadota bacterium]
MDFDKECAQTCCGQVVYSSMCYPHGGMMDDGPLLDLGQDNFRWIGGDDYGGIWLGNSPKAWIKSLGEISKDQIHNIAVQGPKSREILKEVLDSTHQPNWKNYMVPIHHRRIGDMKETPNGFSNWLTGELGYEVWCHPKDAPDVWDAVWEAGQEHEIMPLGLDALDLCE